MSKTGNATAGIDWLCAAIAALATAVAFVPAVADLLPGNIETRAPHKEDVGASLASAEHMALHYALARRLSTMAEAERKAVLEQLRERTTGAERAM